MNNRMAEDIVLPAPLKLVIFDCDGVLIDSEAVVNQVVAEQLTTLGWAMTGAESQAMFLGMSLSAMLPIIEARVGPLSPDWLNQLSRRILDALESGVPPIPGAEALLRATSAIAMPWRIASNSSRAEMAVKFARTGFDRIIDPGRIHSAGDVIAQGGRGKPAPDLFLAAAAAEGVAPRHCVVIEDSVPGARAARAAGMACIGFAPHGDGTALRDEGAMILHDLAALPPLFQAAMERAAP